MTRDDEDIVIPNEAEVSQFGAGESKPHSSRADDNETVDSLKRQLAEAQDKLLRAQAETVNVAKRLQLQHAQSLRHGAMDLARELLPVMDNLERTLDSLKGAEAGDPVLAGVKLIHEQLGKVMRDHGIEVIDALGQPFDPRMHEALMQDSDSDQPPGTVTKELQRGYRMHDRVLRPARVALVPDTNRDD